MAERDFQKALIQDIKSRFPGCIVLKNDPTYIQGFPDLLILYNDKWAALEVKKNVKASHRPNQDYYISKTNQMSYGAFISPENKEDILNDIQSTFRT